MINRDEGLNGFGGIYQIQEKRDSSRDVIAEFTCSVRKRLKRRKRREQDDGFKKEASLDSDQQLIVSFTCFCSNIQVAASNPQLPSLPVPV